MSGTAPKKTNHAARPQTKNVRQQRARTAATSSDHLDDRTGNKNSTSATDNTQSSSYPVAKSSRSETRVNEATTARQKQDRTSGTVAKLGEKSRSTVDAGPISQRLPDYTIRPIVPADRAELLPVARAMHREEFAPRVKKLFDPERAAAMQALETGVYIGWRCPEFTWDCFRVGREARCFCDHPLSEHDAYTGASVRVKCRTAGCQCPAFAFIASRPEDIGEWWLRRRPGFDEAAWRANCSCKHAHTMHVASHTHRCRAAGCGCASFTSAFLCAACDRHWEEHETAFDTVASRQQRGLPVGKDVLPFSELPDLRNIVLTGREDDNRTYQSIEGGPNDIPSTKPTKLALQLRGGFT